MSKKRVKQIGYSQQTLNYADSLDETSELDQIPTEELKSLEQYLTESIPVLIRSSKCVKARNYQRLLEVVKIEYESRQSLQLKPMKRLSQLKHPRLDAFDDETYERIKAVEDRSDKMDKEVIDIWETQLKQRYFIPSPSIAEMRSRAQRMKERGDIPDADKLNQEADQFEEEDRKQMEESYERDLQAARNDERRKCINEINRIKKQRAIQREMLENEIRAEIKRNSPKKASPKKNV